MQPFITNATQHADRTAIVADGQTYTYQQLLDDSARMAGWLLDGRDDLAEARVAFMITPGFDYVRVQWGIWRAGGIAVPLALSYPPPSLRYVLEDTGAAIVVADAGNADILAPLAAERGIRLIVLGQGRAGCCQPALAGAHPRPAGHDPVHQRND